MNLPDVHRQPYRDQRHRRCRRCGWRISQTVPAKLPDAKSGPQGLSAGRFLGEPIPEVAALPRLLRADAKCIPVHSCTVLLDLGVVLAPKRGGRYLTFLGATQTVIARRCKGSTYKLQVSERHYELLSICPGENAHQGGWQRALVTVRTFGSSRLPRRAAYFMGELSSCNM